MKLQKTILAGVLLSIFLVLAPDMARAGVTTAKILSLDTWDICCTDVVVNVPNKRLWFDSNQGNGRTILTLLTSAFLAGRNVYFDYEDGGSPHGGSTAYKIRNISIQGS